MSVWGVYGVYMKQNKGNMIFLIFRYFRTALARAPGFSAKQNLNPGRIITP